MNESGGSVPQGASGPRQSSIPGTSAETPEASGEEAGSGTDGQGGGGGDEQEGGAPPPPETPPAGRTPSPDTDSV